MNENNITVIAAPVQEEDGIDLDLLDLLAAFLLKWKTIIALLLVGALLGFGYARMKNNKAASTTTITEEEAVASARAKLSEDKAIAVEQLFFQYVSYLDLQKEMRAFYRDFVTSDIRVDNTVQMRSEYYITSNIRGLDNMIVRLAVTEEDYQAMRDIAPDEEAGAPIYNRVAFTSVYNEKNSPSNDKENPIQESLENAYLIHVELYGNSEEQCREMMAVIDEAFRRAVGELKLLDSEIKIEKLGEQFNNNVVDYIQTLQKKNIDKMTVAESELNNLIAKVGKLSEAEKSYYDLLQQRYDKTYVAASTPRVTTKKWAAIGSVLGVAIGFCAVFLPYLTDGKIKTAEELEENGKVLNRVFIKEKKNLFGKLAAGLIHGNDTDPTVKADMVATDINILMEKNGKNSLLLLRNEEDTTAAGFAEQVKTRLQAKNSDLKVIIGNPLSSVDELEVAAQSEMGVIFAEMKKSKRAMLYEWSQICERYKVPLAGSVAVHRCW